MPEESDICPVTKAGMNGLEWECVLPRKHIKLVAVKKGDKRQKFINPKSPHVFKPRLPYRNEE